MLESCPLCVTAARLIEPIAQVDTATRVAAVMVWLSFFFGLVGLAYFVQTKVTTTMETSIVGVGGLVLAFAPVVFVMLLPGGVPIHLDYGGYAALLFGIVALVTATAALRIEEPPSTPIRDGWAKEEEEDEHLEATAAATYGTLRRA